MVDVSVIIPMYNAEKTVLSSLQSVLDQTYKGKIEIIVVDDGSIDNSYSLVKTFARDKDNIKILSKKNGGVSSARNVGIKNADGRYLAFLDSDDEWFPEKIEVQMSILENDRSISLLGCLFTNKSLKNSCFKKFCDLTEITINDLIYKNFFQPSTVIIDRTIISKIGYFDENQRYAEEGNFFMRICSEFKCVLQNRQLIYFGGKDLGYMGNGLSSNLLEMEKGEMKNLKFALKHNYISFFSFSLAFVFSILKFFRRIIIVKLLS